VHSGVGQTTAAATTDHKVNTGSYSPQLPDPACQIGPILETTLQQAPFLHVCAGKLQSAVTCYWTM